MFGSVQPSHFVRARARNTVEGAPLPFIYEFLAYSFSPVNSSYYSLYCPLDRRIKLLKVIALKNHLLFEHVLYGDTRHE